MAGKSGAIRAGRAFVELFADKSKMVRGLKSASADFKAWGSTVAGIGARVAGVGAAIGAPLLGFAALAGKVGGDLVDASAKTGLTVEALSTLGYAAGQGGVQMETLTGSVGKMQKNLVAAAQGSKGAKKALADVGLTAEGLAGLSTEDQFKAIAEGLSHVTDPAAKTAAAMALFGKSGAELLPILAGGSKGLNEMQAQARKLGLEISTADAEGADKFGDSLDTLAAQGKALAVRLGSAVIPLVQKAVDWFALIGGQAATWIAANRQLIQTVAMVAGGLVAAGGVITAIGFALSGVGSVLGLVATALPIVGAGFAAVGAIIGALLSPLGLVAAAVVGVGSYLVYTSGAGGEALAWLGGAFDTVAGDASTAWGGIKSALAAGDLGAAAAVGLSFLKLEFTRALSFLETKWAEFSAWVFNAGADAWYSTATAMSDAYGGFESFLAESFPGLYEAWTGFTTWVSNSWAELTGFLAEKWTAFEGWLNDTDTSAVQAQIASDTQGTVNKNNDEAARRLALDQGGRLADIEARRKQRADGFAAANAAGNAGRNASRDKSIADAEKALKDAQDGFAATVQTATAAGSGEGKAKPGLAAFDPAKAGLDTGKIAAGLGAATSDAKGRTAGTFSGAFAGQSLGVGRTDERIARNTERTAKNIEKLTQTVTNGGAAFT